MLIGLTLALIGALIVVFARYAPDGRLLPGDIVIRRDGLVIYLPLATMIVLSITLSGILWFISHMRR